ncbi:MAG: T9SS type A sorting domain-containing protein [Bacteroidales bacterium]|nr:T9SS type A sorting domain-containing protein [Bacteroidales bacterium]
MDSTLSGTSALIYWEGELWTSNDHGQMRLFSLDTTTGATMDSIVCGFQYFDMEEVTQDEHYFYFGDFGNSNASLRRDFYIYRMPKQSVGNGTCHVDTIRFTYYGYDPDGERSKGLPTTDYDCEAMVAVGDSLYLFTKQWTTQQTTCYALPKVPGSYTALPKFRLNVNGLITGACYYGYPSDEGQCVLALCGYSALAQPFVYVVYGFSGTDFTHSQRKKILYCNKIGWQTEAIATADGLHYWVTSEQFSSMGMNIPPRLIALDLSEYLAGYLRPVGRMMDCQEPEKSWPTLAPNPTDGIVQLVYTEPDAQQELKVEVWDSQGRMVKHVVKGNTIDLRKQPEGIYVVRMTTQQGEVATRKVRKLPSTHSKH